MSNVTAISTAKATNDTRLRDFNRQLEKLGGQEADGLVAKPSMAIAIVDAAIQNIITVKDAEATFDTYLEGKAKAKAAKNNPNARESVNPQSRKSNISKNRQLIKAAGLITAGIDFAEVIARCATIRAERFAASEAVKPAFDAFVECARRQIESPKEQIGDDVITKAALVAESSAKEKQAFELILEDYKRMWNRRNDHPTITSLDLVVEALKAALGELGVAIPAMSDDEKEAEKAVKKLEALGFKVSR